MLSFDRELARKIPDLKIATMKLAVTKVEERNDALDKLKKEVIEEVKTKYSLETVKDIRKFRCYRDFFWRLGIDPTKVRPASEALIRRILQGGSIPIINTVVDAINLASVKTEIVIDAFDTRKIARQTKIRFASHGEKFLGIGMKHELTLQGGEIVISDADGPIAIYPHRDGEKTKITLQTREILTVSCGVPGIEEKELLNAAKVVSGTIIEFCGGEETSKTSLLPA